MSKGSWFTLFCLLSGLSACAANSIAPKTTQISEPKALILGQDYSELGAVLMPLGTRQRTRIVKANDKPVTKENMYSLNVPPGDYKLNLNCLVVLDNSIRISNVVELRITTEGGKVYQLDARATQDKRCIVVVKK